MTLLQLLRRILGAPITLIRPTVHDEYGEEYSFVHIAWFYGFLVGWWMLMDFLNFGVG
jgi:hypothetical protein